MRHRPRRRGADRLHRRDPPGVGARRRRPGEPRRRGQRRRQRGRRRAGRARRASAARSTTRACVRKTDTTSLVAFSSPQIGPLGRVTEGHPTIWSRIPRNPTLDPPHLDRRVFVVPTAAGDDGALARAALATEPDGVVDRHARRRPPRPGAARALGRGRRADPGGRLLPPRARRDPQFDLRLRAARRSTCARPR